MRKINKWLLFVLFLSLLSTSVLVSAENKSRRPYKPANQADLIGFWKVGKQYIEFTKDNRFILHVAKVTDLKIVDWILNYKVVENNIYELTGQMGSKKFNKTRFFFYYEDDTMKIGELRRSGNVEGFGVPRKFKKISAKEFAAYKQSVQASIDKRKAHLAKLKSTGQYDMHQYDRENVIVKSRNFVLESRYCQRVTKAELKSVVINKENTQWHAIMVVKCNNGKTIALNCYAQPLKLPISCQRKWE